MFMLRRCSRSACSQLSSAQGAQRSLSAYAPQLDEIKKLRAASEAPIKDCKQALLAAEGDFPKAFEWLRKKGIASATAKAGRTAAEGLVGAYIDPSGKKGAMVEINSETDFVARNDRFQNLVVQSALSMSAWDECDKGAAVAGENFLELPVQSEDSSLKLAEMVPELIGKVGENVVARRGYKFAVNDGLICSYLHNVASPGLGRAGSMIALEYDRTNATEEVNEEISNFGRRLAMHAVAAKPAYLSREDVPADKLEKERTFLMEQAANSGKPQNILEKMIDGRLNKYYAEVVLLEQDHLVEEGAPKISKLLQQMNKKLGVDVKVTDYARFQIGEEQTV